MSKDMPILYFEVIDGSVFIYRRDCSRLEIVTEIKVGNDGVYEAIQKAIDSGKAKLGLEQICVKQLTELDTSNFD